MNTNNATLFIISIALFVYFTSCTNNSFYESEVEIPNGIWDSKKLAIFEPIISDTLQNFSLLMSVSNTDEYRYSNMWFFIKTISPEGFTHKDTIEVFLAEDNGKWLGSKNGNSWTTEFYFKQKVRFPKLGKYTFEIEHGMRDIELKGITRVGINLKLIN